MAATSFLGSGFIPTFDVDEWRCEFGTETDEQVAVLSGQRVLMTAQGIVLTPSSSASWSFDFAVAWRVVGDSTNGTLGHVLQFSGAALPRGIPSPMHATELTPTLDADTYEFGVCVNPNQSATVGARDLYGTVLVIDADT